MRDLVFPDGNEKELAADATRLGIKSLIYCYDDPKEMPAEKPGTTALLVKERKDVGKLKKHADLLIGPCKREFFEDKRIDAVISPGLDEKKDHTHHRRSLTQVEADLAKKQEKTIYLPLSDALQAKRQAELLGRWSQDIRILEKRNAPYAIVSGAKTPLGLRAPKDLDALKKTLT